VPYLITNRFFTHGPLFIPMQEEMIDSYERVLREFVALERDMNDAVTVRRAYVDLCDDLVAGIVLSQIVYWFRPDRSGKSKLTIEISGKLWLAKKREDWWEECRIMPKRADRALALLKEKGIIETCVAKFNSIPMTHIHINLKTLAEKLMPVLKIENGGGVTSQIGNRQPSLFGNGSLPESGRSYTVQAETTTKTTREGELELQKRADVVYQVYPRKVARPEALKSIARAIKHHGFDKVYERTALFKSICRENDQDPAFIAHPATWYNQQRYLDDPATWVRKPRQSNGKPQTDCLGRPIINE
jgi:hypothetical protein